MGLGPKRLKPRIERATTKVTASSKKPSKTKLSTKPSPSSSSSSSNTVSTSSDKSFPDNDIDIDIGIDDDDNDSTETASQTKTTAINKSLPTGYIPPISKLLHKSTLSLHRAIKKIKTNELKKVMKRFKDASTPTSNDKERMSVKYIKNIENEVGRWKNIDVDVIAEVCLRRLGLKNTGVGNDPLENHLSALSADIEETRGIIEKIISAKELSAQMDVINSETLELRQRDMSRTEAITRGTTIHSKSKKREILKKNILQNEWSKVKNGVSSYQGQQGVFLNLNGTAVETDEGVEGTMVGIQGKYDSYGPGGDGTDEWADVVNSQKNRKGQRARRAKAQAKEANKRGEKWVKSINWRPKKEGESDGPHDVNPTNEITLKALPKKGGYEKKEVGAMGKEWKTEGMLHPSWAAKHAKEKEKGIPVFEGKKITFD